MNKHILTILAVFAAITAYAGEPNYEKLADAVKKVEHSVKYPYGVKSINTHGDEVAARRICINTCRNNYKRWVKAGSNGAYLDFLANVYCPVKADPTGNKNWKVNIRKFYQA